MTGFFSEAEQIQRRVVGATIVLVVLSIIGFGIGKSDDSAQEVFWTAVKNSMSTTAVTITATGSTSGETERVVSQLDFGPVPSSRTLTTLSNSGASAETEALTTPKAEYTRYDYIHKKGKAVNFSSVEGLWAKTSSFEGDLIPPTFAQTLLSQPLPIPIGNLTSSERTSLLGQIQSEQIYTVDFPSAKRVTYRDRAAYAYKVSIQPVLYLQLLKGYAPEIGMQQLRQVNPNQYDGQPDVVATWTIDAKSKQLVQADYGAGRVEDYGGWGVPITISAPTHAISAGVLQQRLNSLL